MANKINYKKDISMIVGDTKIMCHMLYSPDCKFYEFSSRQTISNKFNHIYISMFHTILIWEIDKHCSVSNILLNELVLLHFIAFNNLT